MEASMIICVITMEFNIMIMVFFALEVWEDVFFNQEILTALFFNRFFYVLIYVRITA